MNDYPPNATLLPGRWQPLHKGHKRLIQALLDEGRHVVIGIFDTPPSKRNPWTVYERAREIKAAFEAAHREGRLSVMRLPWVQDIAFGRDCGWKARQVRLDAETEQIAATEIRQEIRDGHG